MLLAAAGIVLVILMCGAIWSRAIAVTPSACPDEPPKSKKREYENWKRECDLRNAQNNTQDMEESATPKGLRVTLGLGEKKRRGLVEGQRLLA